MQVGHREASFGLFVHSECIIPVLSFVPFPYGSHSRFTLVGALGVFSFSLGTTFFSLSSGVGGCRWAASTLYTFFFPFFTIGIPGITLAFLFILCSITRYNSIPPTSPTPPHHMPYFVTGPIGLPLSRYCNMFRIRVVPSTIFPVFLTITITSLLPAVFPSNLTTFFYQSINRDPDPSQYIYTLS